MTEEVRVAANVVTSENLAEFNAKRLGLADREAVVEATPTEPQEQSEPVEAKEERQQQRIENRIQSWRSVFQRLLSNERPHGKKPVRSAKQGKHWKLG